MTTIHFAHANGFPAATYNTLFSALPADWNVLANPQFGHKPEFPVAGNWQKQVDELVWYLDSQEQYQPVWLAGHSFGAMLSYMTACRYPQRVKGVIMLDPPMVYGAKQWLVRGAKKLNLMDRITPSRLAKIRRTHWHKDDDLEGYFAGKALFRNMDKRCIRDYVAAGTVKDGENRRLTFDRQVEAEIFRHFPHNLHQFSGKLQCPGLMVAGSGSDVAKPSDRARFVKDNALEFRMFDGGHMFPLEQPEKVAEIITTTIQRWQAG